jgi:ribosomal protein S27E
MAALVDYRCDGCDAVHEVFAPSPVADTIACPDCGEVARRRFGLGGLLGVKPAKAAKDRLDRQRATRRPSSWDPAHDHDHHHHTHDHHDHEHHHAKEEHS